MHVCIIRFVRSYSTVQAASELGIGRDTLHRWIRLGKIKPPAAQKVGGISIRLWTAEDLKRVRAYMKENYREGGGRPKR
jgi:predicted site-specific integrase-resolvase